MLRDDSGFADELLGADAPSAGDDDRRLDDAFASGEDSALREVYERYGSLVFSYCRRSLSAEAAADAAQETFVSAWRSRESYDRGRGTVAGWLMGIARFKVIEQLRRSGRDVGAADPGQASLDRGHDGELDRIADRMLVVDALDQLAPRVRTVVELALLRDLTHAEIAERCELPLGTVKSDVRRGLERMRRHLAGRSEVNHGF